LQVVLTQQAAHFVLVGVGVLGRLVPLVLLRQHQVMVVLELHHLLLVHLLLMLAVAAARHLCPLVLVLVELAVAAQVVLGSAQRTLVAAAVAEMSLEVSLVVLVVQESLFCATRKEQP
jgi:hypothetical protein